MPRSGTALLCPDTFPGCTWGYPWRSVTWNRYQCSPVLFFFISKVTTRVKVGGSPRGNTCLWGQVLGWLSLLGCSGDGVGTKAGDTHPQGTFGWQHHPDTHPPGSCCDLAPLVTPQMPPQCPRDAPAGVAAAPRLLSQNSVLGKPGNASIIPKAAVAAFPQLAHSN